jgi:hypothetical protein
MKRIILLSCLFLLTTIAAFAQLPAFNLGLKAGANYSSLKTSSDLTDQNRILGYQIGAWARIGGGGFYLQPEAYLGSKGNDFIRIEQEDGVQASASGKVRFTTLDVPLLLGNKIGIDKLNIRFMAGPVASFIIDKKTTFASAYDDVTNFGNYKDQTWGAQAGAGVDIGNLSFDLRYEAGLSNVSRSGQYDQKQNLWHLSLGLKLL